MKVIENENTIFFDVDGTLILHGGSREGDHSFDLEPDGLFGVFDKRINRTIIARAYYPHIDILLQSHSRGRVVVVWSASGYQWAEMIVNALKISDKVTMVMTKPSAYVDDVDANKFMNRVYIEPKKES